MIPNFNQNIKTMKSKIIIAAVMIAILGSFAFISIEKGNQTANNKELTEAESSLNGIVQEDSNF